jgi:hypothetical protein
MISFFGVALIVQDFHHAFAQRRARINEPTTETERMELKKTPSQY